MTDPGPDWKEFEHIIAKLKKAFYPNARIEENEKLLGRRSKIRRQIDVAIHAKLGVQELLIIVECKHWRRKIDVKAVGEFCSVMDDVGAHSGMMISSKGFSKGASNLASQNKISLFRFRDTKREAWPNGLLVPIFSETWELTPLDLYVIDAAGTKTRFKSDEGVTLIDVRDGDIAPATLCRKMWDQFSNKADGRFYFEIGAARDGISFGDKIGMAFSAKLHRRYRAGRFHFQGLEDSKAGEAHASGFEIQSDGESEPVAGEWGNKPWEGGLGLLIKTTIVRTARDEGWKADKLLSRLPFYVKITTKDPIAIDVNPAGS